MGMQVTFSIIVPVYNMEQYLPRCMDSILVQDYKEYELIAVDDGSTDGSLKILEDYKRKNGRIKVIHKENGGIGTAILAGLSVAVNEYIVFVDSDDYVESKMLSELNQCIIDKGKVDAVQYGLAMVNEEGALVREERHGNYVLRGTDKILWDHFRCHPTPSLACRTFKRALFSGAVCPAQNVGIDEVLIVQLLLKTETFVSTDDVLYHVYLRAGSVSRSVYTKEKMIEYEKLYEILFDIAEMKKELLWNYVAIKYIKLLIGVLSEMKFEHSEFSRLKGKFDEYYNEVRNSDEFREETASFKVGAALFYRSPTIYWMLKSLQMRWKGKMI